MHYPYRWFYAAIICLLSLFIGFFYDIKPLLMQLDQLKITETEWQTKLTTLPKMTQQEISDENLEVSLWVKQPHQSEQLSDLLSLIYLSGLSVYQLRFLPNQQLDGLTDRGVHLVVHGDFYQIFALIVMFSKQQMPVILKEFSCHITEQNKFIFAMEIRILNGPLNTMMKPYQDHHLHSQHLFCKTAAVTHQPKEINAELQSVPLHLIKMVGFLQQDKRRRALISLPNGSVMMVALGMVLGKEHGVIVDIQPRHLVVSLPNKKLFMINSSIKR